MRKLAEAPLKRGDGVYLEFMLDLCAPEGELSQYVVLPFMEQAGLEHKYTLNLYTDVEVKFEKIVPKNLGMDCVQCGNPTALNRVLTARAPRAQVPGAPKKERTLVDRGPSRRAPRGRRRARRQTAAQAAFARADTNKGGRGRREFGQQASPR